MKNMTLRYFLTESHYIGLSTNILEVNSIDVNYVSNRPNANIMIIMD